MGSHNPHIPLVTEPLTAAEAEGEIVLATQHDATSLTPEAARETARRLMEAAERLDRI